MFEEVVNNPGIFLVKSEKEDWELKFLSNLKFLTETDRGICLLFELIFVDLTITFSRSIFWIESWWLEKIKKGYNFIAFSLDTLFLGTLARNELKKVRDNFYYDYQR